MANWGQGGWTNTYSYTDLRTDACFENIPRLRISILSAKELDEFEGRWFNVIVFFLHI
jgi:hypothetical protein